MDALVEFIKILVPASVVLYGAYLLVRMFIQKEVDLKKLEVRGKSIETVLPNRLQAYERMALFLERISPQNLLVRLNASGMTSKEFHQLLLSEIRSEYNHNVAQQVYMSENIWKSLLMIVAAILYFINPIDIIPDLLPLVGLTDDFAILFLVYKSIGADIDKFLAWEKSKTIIIS